MASREYIHSVVRANHVIAVHMKEDLRINSLSSIIYVIYDLILSEEEEKFLIMNRAKGVDTDGPLKIKAVRTSKVDISLEDSKPNEYIINTKDIVKFETLNM